MKVKADEIPAQMLEHYGKKNQLNRYLSSMSTYKYPKMEELYEAAHL